MTTSTLRLHALARLLKPGGRFVFSVPHRCFNLNGTKLVLEVADREGQLVEMYALKVSNYLHVPSG